MGMKKKKNEEGAVVCFCGSYPVVQEFSGEYRHHNDGMWDIECSGCGLEIRMCWTQQGAIDGWNGMMDQVFTLPPGMIAAMRMLVEHLNNQKLPTLDLIVAKDILSRFLRENIQEKE